MERTLGRYLRQVQISLANMIFLKEIDCIAHNLTRHLQEIAQRETAVCAAYQETIQIVQHRIDQLAYVFIVAPLCYDTEQMYEKLKHTLCGILQLLQAQQHKLKALLLPDDEDFLIVLSESLTKLCVRMLCESNFIQIEPTASVVS